MLATVLAWCADMAELLPSKPASNKAKAWAITRYIVEWTDP